MKLVTFDPICETLNNKFYFSKVGIFHKNRTLVFTQRGFQTENQFFKGNLDKLKNIPLKHVLSIKLQINTLFGWVGGQTHLFILKNGVRG